MSVAIGATGAPVSAAGTPVTGTFFIDLDRDGSLDAGEVLDPTDVLYPVDGVAVDVFDAAGGTGSCLVTGTSYACDVSGLAGTDFRLEFSLSSDDLMRGFSPTVRGVDSASDVQFASAGSTADFGVTPPSQCPTTGDGFNSNPNSAAGKLWTTCYVNGDRDAGGPQEVFVGMNFDGSGAVEPIGVKGNQDPTVTTASELGALWGVAYDEWESTLFTSAVVRRHVDLGREGVDGLYWASYPSGVWNAVSLGDVAGAPSYGDDFTRDLAGTAPTTPTYDNAAFPLVARRGIGDIDVTPDGRTLLVSNLNTRSVDVYDVSDAASGTAPTFLRTVSVINPGCAGDPTAYQVWALEAVDATSGYVGVTCTGEGASSLPGDLQAFVVPFDPVAGTSGAAVLTVPLGYTKSCDSNFGSGCPAGANYQPWLDVWGNGAQAILSDIDQTADGSLVLGILDRYSMQGGQGNYPYDPTETDTTLAYVVSNGDILHACNTSGDANNPTWVLEGAGVSDCDAAANFPDTTGGDFNNGLNNIGVGGAAEWYGDERLLTPADEGHSETAQGGLFVDAYGSQVATSSMNPEAFESGGIKWYDTASGATTNRLTLFSGPATAGYAGKATGIGDIEGCTLPVEIGDFVWLDANRNGIQDPGEPGLEGVTVTLLDAGGATVATTRTLADGSYTFGTVDGLLASTAYMVTFDVLSMTNTAVLPAGVAPVDLAETIADQGTDERDSDSVGGKINFTSPASGTTDHSFDAGFVAPDFEYRIGSLVWLDLDDDGLAEPGETPLAGVNVELLDEDGDVITNTTTNAAGEYVFDGLAGGTYSVRVLGDQDVIAPYASSGTPNANADDNVDNDNNGVPTAGNYVSGPVVLGDGSTLDEPVGEANGITGVSNEPDDYPDARSNQSVDFGFADKPTLELGNHVWIDADNNGELDAGEASVEGVTVELVDMSGNVLATDTTDATGRYLFTELAPGSYMVSIPASNFADGAPLAGYLPSSGPAASSDPNDDVDANSDGVAQADGSVKSGTIDLSIGDEPTADSAPSDGVADENSNVTVDFGFYVLQLGDTVWIDADNSGTFDSGEDTAPAGVTVELLDPSGSVLATTTTDGNGMYLFDGLAEGDYIVSLPASNFASGGPLAGYVSSTGNGDNAPDPDDDVDNDDNGTPSGGAIVSSAVTLSAGDEPVDGSGNPTVDFGVIPTGSIGSVFFEDFGSDGQRGPGDVGVGGVTVRLLDENGLIIATTTTDEDGMYLFDGLPPGKYIVEFEAPTGRIYTVPNTGDDATDSDADPTTGRTGVIMLGLGDDDLDNDAGITPALLPATGSDSTYFTLQLAASLLLIGAGIALMTRRRRSLRVW